MPKNRPQMIDWRSREKSEKAYKMAEKKEKAVEEVTTLNKKLADGEEYFAVAHIFASNNDTFVVSFKVY